MNNKEFLLSEMNNIGISLSDHQVDQFLKYYDLLIEWNSFMNLTAITDYEEVVTKHFVDSLVLSKVYDLKQTLNLIDIGTGAGFPGIPLKIVFPQIQVILLDSLKKRINFLDEIIRSLNLSDIVAVHGRAEDFAKQKEMRDSYDICVSRAVANLSSLTELCLPFVKVGGRFISYKSEKVSDELETAKNAITQTGGELHSVDNFYICNDSLYRSFITILKVKETPSKFPRKAGMAVKSPIT